MGKKEFTVAVSNPEHEIYVFHVGSINYHLLPSSSPIDVHPFRRLQIFGLIVKETPTKIPAKYLDFANLYFPDLASELPEYTGINNHAT